MKHISKLLLAFVLSVFSLTILVSCQGKSEQGQPDDAPSVTDSPNATQATPEESGDGISVKPFEPTAPSGGETADISDLLRNAEDAFNQKDPGLARSYLDQALSMVPDSPDGLFLRSEVLFDLGDFQGALDDIEAFLIIDPENAAAYNQRGHIHDTLGEYELAFEDYDRATEIDPVLPEPYLNRGFLYMILYGDYESALTELRQYVVLAPEGVERDAAQNLITDLEFELTPMPETEEGGTDPATAE